MIKLGANIDLGDLNDKSILQYAIESNNDKVIEYFTAFENQNSKSVNNFKQVTEPTWQNTENQNLTSLASKTVDKYIAKKQKNSSLTKIKSPSDNSPKPAKRVKTVPVNLENNEEVIHCNNKNLKSSLQLFKKIILDCT